MANAEAVALRIIDREDVLHAEPTAEGRVVVIPDMLRDRYASFKLIPWWDQARLTAARVIVVGAGALGNEVLKNLALLGIGHILIVDCDRVEYSNLGRSVLFRASDVGRPKAAAAADGVRALNLDVEARALWADVTTDVGLGIFRRADAIIGCLDNRLARLALNSAAYRLNQPWIDGAIDELFGIARVFWPGRGACYQCTLTPADWQAINLHYSCTVLAREQLQQGRVPTTPTTAAIIAAVQTQEALKILHGLTVEAGVAFVYNGLTNRTYVTTYPRLAGCLEHDNGYGEIEALPWATATGTTTGELLALARARLGPDAQLELDYELVAALACPRCGGSAEILAALRSLSVEQMRCPQCGGPRTSVTMHTVTGEERFMDRSLADIGVPLLHVVNARSGDRYWHFELTGDAG